MNIDALCASIRSQSVAVVVLSSKTTTLFKELRPYSFLTAAPNTNRAVSDRTCQYAVVLCKDEDANWFVGYLELGRCWTDLDDIESPTLLSLDMKSDYSGNKNEFRFRELRSVAGWTKPYKLPYTLDALVLFETDAKTGFWDRLLLKTQSQLLNLSQSKQPSNVFLLSLHNSGLPHSEKNPWFADSSLRTENLKVETLSLERTETINRIQLPHSLDNSVHTLLLQLLVRQEHLEKTVDELRKRQKSPDTHNSRKKSSTQNFCVSIGCYEQVRQKNARCPKHAAARRRNKKCDERHKL